MKDVASEIGVSPGSLASVLTEECMAPDLHCKVVDWLINHAYIGSSFKNLKFKIKSTITCKAEIGFAHDSEAVAVSESDIPDVVSVKSVPPRRRTKGNIRILNDEKVTCSSKEIISNDGLVIDEAHSGHFFREDLAYPSKDFVADFTEKMSVEAVGVPNSLPINSLMSEATVVSLPCPSDPNSLWYALSIQVKLYTWIAFCLSSFQC
ncbi:unnamed protein product [Ilex paraguariensis]|uniref:Uncharacterized protein n=1 Tax=Ilex paraguariensis TaxID=185542 RepID=A0ABC8TW28_9AQUA